jgi:hypothetical protein
MSTLEYELEYELEGEEFVGGAGGMISRAITPQLLRRIGGTAARAVMHNAMGPLGYREFEGEIEGEFESEYEGEALLNPIRRVYPDAMMEHFGHAAAAAETEEEAEAFIGALIPLAARLLPRVAPAVMRAAPGLIRGVSGVVRTLRANPATRPLVRAVPTIVRRTVADIDRQSAGGAPVTAQQAVQTLARQTGRVLSSPQQCTHALRRNVALDKRFHQAARAQPTRIAV